MHERVTMLGGSFSITSRIGSGTKITMSVPYENNDR
jgi:signal transduction histidine kinase